MMQKEAHISELQYSMSTEKNMNPYLHILQRARQLLMKVLQ